MNRYPCAESSGDLNQERKALGRNGKTCREHGRIMAERASGFPALLQMKFRQSVGMSNRKHGLSDGTRLRPFGEK
jgi:hypothetical protein